MAAGEALAISIPRAEAPAIRYFQARMPCGWSCPTFHEVKKAPASLYRGFRSDQSCVQWIAPLNTNSCPKNAGRCPKDASQTIVQLCITPQTGDQRAPKGKQS
jgi:hypothetical protein